MSFVSEITQFFQDQSFGTRGTDIFQDEMPEQPDACISVNQTGGSNPEHGFGVVGIDIERPTAQIKVRGVLGDNETPRSKAEQLYRLLMTVMAQSLSTTYYRQIFVLQKPQRLGPPDSKGRITWVFNIMAEKKLSAAV